ncbi:hypothetical protein KAU11_11490 [Candidatus Babeliales bacterium]|nr:hypothetical protein [Candidatus Babeliales bacterium]
MESKGVVVFALDIEARGQGPKRHGIMSIGVCVGSTQENKVIHKERFDMLPLEGQEMEKRCDKEFWSNNVSQYYRLTKNGKAASIQIKTFRDLLDKCDREYDDVYVVCDNPGFDFGMINYYLDYFQLPTLNYKINPSGSLSYRNNHDSDSYSRAVLNYNFDEPWMSNKVLIGEIGANELNADDHDHMPENDAEFLYKLHYSTVLHQVSKKEKNKRQKTTLL